MQDVRFSHNLTVIQRPRLGTDRILRWLLYPEGNHGKSAGKGGRRASTLFTTQLSYTICSSSGQSVCLRNELLESRPWHEMKKSTASYRAAYAGSPLCSLDPTAGGHRNETRSRLHHIRQAMALMHSASVYTNRSQDNHHSDPEIPTSSFTASSTNLPQILAAKVSKCHITRSCGKMKKGVRKDANLELGVQALCQRLNRIRGLGLHLPPLAGPAQLTHTSSKSGKMEKRCIFARSGT